MIRARESYDDIFIERKDSIKIFQIACLNCLLNDPLANFIGIKNMKACTKCKNLKPLTDFRKASRGKNGISSWCRQCLNKASTEYIRKRLITDIEFRRKQNTTTIACNKKKYANDPVYRHKINLRTAERIRTHSASDPVFRRKIIDNAFTNALKRKYGITRAQYDQMLADQCGVCKLCGRTDKDGKALAVDHNHTTGKVRGLLCTWCNVRVGIIEDDIFRHRVEKYLESR